MIRTCRELLITGDRMIGRGMPGTINIFCQAGSPEQFRCVTRRYPGPSLRKHYQRQGCRLSPEPAHPGPGL